MRRTPLPIIDEEQAFDGLLSIARTIIKLMKKWHRKPQAFINSDDKTFVIYCLHEVFQPAYEIWNETQSLEREPLLASEKGAIIREARQYLEDKCETIKRWGVERYSEARFPSYYNEEVTALASVLNKMSRVGSQNGYDAVDNAKRYAYWETQGWYHLCYDSLLWGEQHAITAAMRREDGYRWENTARSEYLHTLGTRLIRTEQVYQALSWYTQWFRQSRQVWQGNGAVLHYFVRLMGAIAQIYRDESLTLLPEQSSTENPLSEGIAYRNSLTRERATLEEQLPHQPRAAIEQWNYHLYDMVRDIAKQVDELFEDEEERHPWCLVLLGSLSREMAVAYSDVECGLLVEDNSVFAGWDKDSPETDEGKALYRWFTAIEMIIASMHDDGFVLDSNAQPRIEPALRGTPATLIKKLTHTEVTAEDGLVYSLLHPRFGYGRIGLYKYYLDQLHQAWEQPCTRPDVQRLPWESPQLAIPYHRYWATAQIGRNRQGWETYSATCPSLETLPESLDIKKPFLKSLTFFPLDIALYHGIETHRPEALKQYTLPALIERLVALGYMDKTQAKVWQEEWEAQLYHRCAHQLANAGADSLAIAEASEEIRATYQRRHELLSRWVQRLSIWESQGYRPFQQAGWLSELLHRSDSSNESAALVQYGRQVTPSDCTLQILSPAYPKPLVLHPDWEAALFDDETGKVKTTTSSRNSGVFIRGDTVLKVLLPDETDEEKQKAVVTTYIAREQLTQTFEEAQKAVVTTYIAREQLTQTLAHLCQWSVVPLGVGGIVTRKGVRYGVWISETIVGQDMTALVLPMQKGGPFRSLEETTSDKTKSLHHWSSGALLLLNLLLSPEDMHPKNLRWTGHQWVSVDNKRMWVKPSTSISKWLGLHTEVEIHHKSIFYALAPRIQWDEHFKTHFLGLLPQPLIREWTSQMQGWDKQVAALLDYESQAEGWHAATLGTAMPLLLQFQWAFMQKKIREGLTPQDLIKVWMPPALAKSYRELRQGGETDAALFENFYKQFKYRSTMTEHQTLKYFSKTTVAHINAQHLALEDFQREYFPVLREDLKNLDWRAYTVLEEKIVLNVLRLGALTHLNLTGCTVAQESDVKTLIEKSPHLETLNLTGQSFPETVLEAMTYRHESLTTLIWDAHPLLKKIEIMSRPLMQLKVLSLQRCPQLEIVAIHTISQLEELRLMGSPHAVVTPKSKRQALSKMYYSRGYAKRSLGHHEEAIRAFDTALQLDPNDAKAYNNRGVAKDSLGHYEEAIGDFDAALRLGLKNGVVYYGRGCAKFELGRYAEALGDYDEALRLGFKNAEVYYNRRRAKGQLGRYEEAIADYDEALRLDPKNAKAYSNRGLAKRQLGRYAEAIADYDESLRLGLKNAVAYTNRGNVKQFLGRYEEAIADYDEALRLDPGLAEAYNNRGYAKCSLGRCEEALVDYDESLRLGLKNAVAYTNRGLAKYYLGRYEEAIADYDEALRLDPGLAEAYNNRGYAKCSLGRCEEALVDYDEALRLGPENAVAYYTRGLVKQCQGRYQGALLDYQQALHYTSNDLKAVIMRTYRCAYLLHALGHKASSALQVSKALALIPTSLKEDSLAANEQPLTIDVMQQWRYYLKLLLIEGDDDRAAVVAKHMLLLSENYPHPWLIHYVRMEVAEFAMKGKQYGWVKDILDTLPKDGPWEAELKSRYYQLRGRLCLQRDEMEEAGNAIAAALKTNPYSGENDVWACHYYQQCGQWDKAIRYGVMALLRLPVVCEEQEQLRACWQEAGMTSHSLPVLSLQEAIQAGYCLEDSPLVWLEEWDQLEDAALLQQVVNQTHKLLLAVSIGTALEAGDDENVIIQERQLYTPETDDHQEKMDEIPKVTWVLLKWDDTYAVIEMEAPLWLETPITEEMLHDMEEENDTSLSSDNAAAPPSPSSLSQSVGFFSSPLPAANDMTVIFKKAQGCLAAGDERMKDNEIEEAVVHYEQGIALLASLEADERTEAVETLFTALTERLEGAQSLLKQSPMPLSLSSQDIGFFSNLLPAGNDMTVIFKQAQGCLAAGDEEMKDNKIAKAAVYYEQGIALLASLEADERTEAVEILFTTLTERLEGAQSLLEQSSGNKNLAMGGP